MKTNQELIKLKLFEIIVKNNLEEQVNELNDENMKIKFSENNCVELSSIRLTSDEYLNSLKHYDVDKDVFVKYHFKTYEKAKKMLSNDPTLRLLTYKINLGANDPSYNKKNNVVPFKEFIGLLCLTANNNKVYFYKLIGSKDLKSHKLLLRLNEY